MAHHGSETAIQNPGTYSVSSGTKTLFLVMAVLGLVAFGAGVATDPHRAWSAFIHNHFYFLSLGLGGLFFAAIQWLTNAMWSAPVRRLSESLTAYLPFASL